MRTAYKRCYTVSLWIQPDHRAELRYLHVIQQTEDKLHHYTADMSIYI